MSVPDPTVNRNAPRFIPVARPSLTELEARAAYDAVLSGWVSSGPRVEQFEREFAALSGKRYGVSCCSGTAALHLALVATGVGPRDEVVLPSLTMIAVANAVLYCGATPVFVDSREGDGNPDERWLEDCCIAGMRTKAVIVPHLYGSPAAAFLSACRKHVPHAVVIEDCAEAHFASIDGRPVGSFGNLSCWSFFGNKIVANGEGGMVCTNDERTAERLRSLRAHAFSPDTHFHHQELAFGYRTTEMAAAIGLAQLSRREEFIERRKQIAQRYIDHLKGISWLRITERTFESAWWVFPIVLANPTLRNRVRKALADAGVETRSFFHPMHLQPHLRRYATHQYPVAEVLGQRGCYLPIYTDMTDSDVDYVAQVLRNL